MSLVLHLFLVVNQLHAILGSVRRGPIPADIAHEFARSFDYNFYSYYEKKKIIRGIKTNVTFLNCHQDYCGQCKISGFVLPLLLAFEGGNSVLLQNIKGAVNCLRWSWLSAYTHEINFWGLEVVLSQILLW